MSKNTIVAACKNFKPLFSIMSLEHREYCDCDQLKKEFGALPRFEITGGILDVLAIEQSYRHFNEKALFQSGYQD